LTRLIRNYENAVEWVSNVAGNAGPHLMLGNGFSISYDPGIFSYGALLGQAKSSGIITPLAQQFFEENDTQDFELVIRSMTAAQQTLRIMNPIKYETEIAELGKEIRSLKEALASLLAGLHPERPYSVAEDRYARTSSFLECYASIYTTNYDLLLYWTLRQTLTKAGANRADDDGFRSKDDDGVEHDCVYWDHLKPFGQTIHYLHGALHLFRGSDGLRKLTWIRTDKALIDQIREQLSSNFFPLYVSEGTSAEKLAKIQSSDYLSKSLRSLAGIGGGLTIYGLSFSDNDQHFTDAIVKSNVKRIAVSIFGDPSSAANQETIARVSSLPSLRESRRSGRVPPLEVTFYDALSVNIW
jgi:hypothetical protein